VTDTGIYPLDAYGRLKFIKPQYELREQLERLKLARKIVFCTTDYHPSYVNLIMSTSIGRDWEVFFDFVMCDCRKPFWYQGGQYFWTAKEMYTSRLDEVKEGKALLETYKNDVKYYLNGNI
jgi:hypothetical protein